MQIHLLTYLLTYRWRGISRGNFSVSAEGDLEWSDFRSAGFTYNYLPDDTCVSAENEIIFDMRVEEVILSVYWCVLLMLGADGRVSKAHWRNRSSDVVVQQFRLLPRRHYSNTSHACLLSSGIPLFLLLLLLLLLLLPEDRRHAWLVLE